MMNAVVGVGADSGSDRGDARSLLVVVGPGRSGTSLLSTLVQRLGVHVPQPEVKPDPTNPRGFGEPQWAVDFHSKLMRAPHIALTDARPDAWSIAAEATARPQVRTELRSWLGKQLDENPRVIVKDPRVTWFVDLWREVGEDLGAQVSVAMMLRDPIEVTKSRELHYGMGVGSITRAAGWLNLTLFAEHVTRGMPRALIRYDDLLAEWRATLSSADQHLKMGLVSRATDAQLAAAYEMVDPKLRRSSATWEDLAVPDTIRDLSDRTWTSVSALASRPDGSTSDGSSDRFAELDQLRQEYVDLYTASEAIAEASVAAAARKARREARPQNGRAVAPAPEGSLVERGRSGAKSAVVRGVRRAVIFAGEHEWLARPGRPPEPGSRPRVYFLVYSADDLSGVARTVAAQANYLARDHEVEIISLYQRSDRPAYALDPRVKVTHLEDMREPDRTAPGPGHRRPRDSEHRGRVVRALDAAPTRVIPREQMRSAHKELSLLADVVLLRKLRTLRPGILIVTRRTLLVAVARYAPSHVITIGQEHDAVTSLAPNGLAVLRNFGGQLDALVGLTEEDAEAYREMVGGTDTLVATIPNAVPWEVGEQSALDSKAIVTAGRLTKAKGVDRLLEAFRPVAERHPDWKVHVYGHGPERENLQHLIDDAGLGDSFVLEGYHSDMAGVLANASLYAMTSHAETFPMVLLEALSHGVPVVAFDLPRGPRNIITPDETGLLVPDGDIPAFTNALLRLIEDEDLRRKMGAAGLDAVAGYTLDAVGRQWEELFEELIERRADRTPRKD